MNDYLEPRIAYGEGLGNAMGAIINNNPIYRDSANSGGFSFDLESGSHTVEGFYSEFSVQSIIWDLFDSNVDNRNGRTDNISLPFSSIWGAVMDLKDIDGITSFHEFIKALKVREPGQVLQINDLLGMENIAQTEGEEPDISVGIDPWFVNTATMTDHTCNGGTAEYAYNPTFQPITSNYTGTGLKGSQFCGFESPGMNKLFGSRFFSISPSNSGIASINVNFSETPNVDPRMRYLDFFVYEKGKVISFDISSLVSKSKNVYLEAGRKYILETRMYSMCIQNWGNCNEANFANDGETTYNITVNLP